MKRFGPILLGAVLASCNGQAGDGVRIGGETHFLITCDEAAGEGCGAGLSCIDGACTRRCEPNFSTCSELSNAAACVSTAQDEPVASAFSGTCDVLCGGDGDCAQLGEGYLCTAGACRAEPEARAAELESALRSARAPKVIAVDADTCDSGLRWVGGNQGSEEMHPGTDCVGCHRDMGAKPLMLAGTVYAKQSPTYLGPDPLEGCFGLEGIAVTVTDANGKEYSTVTNRAGNFYFEGRESDLAIPYFAHITFNRHEQERLPFFNRTIDRVVEYQSQMYSAPGYGGCARCHSTNAMAVTPDSADGDPDPEWVAPAGSVIFPPGLYPASSP